MTSEIDFTPFITDNPYKTRAMIVTVYDNENNQVNQFSAPPGLRLEQLVNSFYPGRRLKIDISREVFIVTIIVDDKVFGIYKGVYYGPAQYTIVSV